MSNEEGTRLRTPESEDEFGSLDSQDSLVPRHDAASWWLLLFLCLVNAVDYSVCMPSIWLYLQSLQPDIGETWYGLSLASFSLASLIWQPLAGMWLDRRPLREVTVCTIWLTLLGNVLYIVATAPWMILVARFISGAISVLPLVTTVYVLRAFPESIRVNRFAYLNAAFMLGIIGGPALNLLIVSLPTVPLFGKASLNSLNGAGIIMIVPLALGLLQMFIFFVEPPLAAEVVSDKQLSLWTGLRKLIGWETGALLLSGVLLTIGSQFSELLVPPVTQELYSFGQLKLSFFYTALTSIMLVFYLLLAWQGHRFSDRVLSLVGWLFQGVGSLLLIVFQLSGSLELWKFSLGIILGAVGATFLTTATPSLYSKLATRRMEGQDDAFAQSVQAGSTAVGMLLAPLVVGPLLQVGLLETFVTSMALWIVAIIVFLSMWPRYSLPKIQELKIDENE